MKSGDRRETEFGVDKVHFPSNMNEAAKLLKVKGDLWLGWSLLWHSEGTGSEPKWRKRQQSTANRKGHTLSHPAGFPVGLRLREGRGR